MLEWPSLRLDFNLVEHLKGVMESEKLQVTNIPLLKLYWLSPQPVYANMISSIIKCAVASENPSHGHFDLLYNVLKTFPKLKLASVFCTCLNHK